MSINWGGWRRCSADYGCGQSAPNWAVHVFNSKAGFNTTIWEIPG